MPFGVDTPLVIVEGQPERFKPFAPSSQGHAEAMFYLAQAHRSGSPEMGVPQDLQKFGEMVQQAAAAGSGDAMFALGGTFFHGVDGFARDPRAAFRCVFSCLAVSLMKTVCVLARTELCV